MEKQSIYALSAYYDSVSSDAKLTLRYSIRMKEPVQGQALRNSVTHTMERYPYMKIRVRKTWREMFLEPNPAPIVVLNSAEPVVLGSEKVNGHLLALTWSENTIYINVFHGLMDGRALLRFTRTLLYYYCTERYQRVFSSEGIWLSNTAPPITPDETEDPFLKPLIQQESLLNVRAKMKKRVPLHLDKAMKTTSCPLRYERLQIPESAVMSLCHELDGSPTTLLGVLAANAVVETCPGAQEPVIIGFPVDLRSVMHADKYMHSLIRTIMVPFPEKLQSMSLTKQLTAFRGRILLKSDPSELQKVIAMSKKLLDILSPMPLALRRKMMAALVKLSHKGAETFLVSYSGRSLLGEMEPYVDTVYLDADGITNGMEVNVVNGNFCINYTQNWQEDDFFRNFLHQLEKNNIPFRRDGSGTVALPDIIIP